MLKFLAGVTLAVALVGIVVILCAAVAVSLGMRWMIVFLVLCAVAVWISIYLDWPERYAGRA